VTIVNTVVLRLGRIPSAVLSIAIIYGGALVTAGFLAPMYESTSVSSSGEATTHGSGTLVGVNGPGVVVVLSVPLLVTLAVGCALWHRTWRGAVAFGWTLTGLLAVFNLLAMLSIGMFFLPVTAALIVACATVRPRSTRPDPGQTPTQPAGPGWRVPPRRR
jgi:hypothetical protein